MTSPEPSRGEDLTEQALAAAELRVLELEREIEIERQRTRWAYDQMRMMRSSLVWRTGSVVAGVADIGHQVAASALRIGKNIVKGLAPQ